MILLFEFSLPFKDPVLIFCLVLLIILLTPILFKKIKFPSIVGLIIAGVIIGPYGFNLLVRDASIELFGTVGLLYIMFIAGLEIDLADFKLNKNKSIVFGIITFTVPMVLGIVVGIYVLNLGIVSSVLLASMFASHTLLAYPITSGYGINKAESVNITVGGTIITDTAALMVLAVIAGAAEGDLNAQFWIRLIISFIVFVAVIFWVVPYIARWAFKKIDGEGESDFIFSLSVVFGAAFLAELAGVEAIIGAFLSGLALNRFIPHTSPLMNRIEFVGNTLFIPFFLIGVGMLVDVRVLVQGFDALYVALVMIIVAIAAKWIAAFITQKIYHYSIVERNLIFGLSSAQAAATLAVVLVGYNMEIFNVNVLNGTILMILVTCLTSSFITEKAAKTLADLQKEIKPNVDKIQQKILVPISDPETIEDLLDLAVMLKDPPSEEPIFALSVVKDDTEATENLLTNQKILEDAVKYGSSSDNQVRLVSRIDTDTAQGILRCIREMLITDVILSWDGKLNNQTHFFGKVLGNLLLKSNQNLFICRINIPINTIRKIVVAVPAIIEEEESFEQSVLKIKALAKEMGADLHFFATSATNARLKEVIEASKPAVESHYKEFDDWEDFLILARELQEDDLLIVINSRKGAISYNPIFVKIPELLSKYFNDFNFIMIYTAQDVNAELETKTLDQHKDNNQMNITSKPQKKLSFLRNLVGGR
ncbi:MAG: cation:proton antiporter [Bacteroidota bacterium]|nr:cation:proton antiporter [Bacteroidota bacterium]